MNANAGEPGEHTLRCMEIWQGSHDVEAAFNTPGLDAWVHSLPYQGMRVAATYTTSRYAAAESSRDLVVANVSGHGADAAEVALHPARPDASPHQSQEPGTVGPGADREFTAAANAGRFATAVVATYLDQPGQVNCL